MSFTINLAINFVELRTVDEDQPSLGKAHIDFQRIGSLLPDKRHNHWWKLDPEDNLDNVAREVIRDLYEYAIPWLEQRQIFSKTLTTTRIDPEFLLPIQISRLSVVAGRAERDDLSAELRQLARRGTQPEAVDWSVADAQPAQSASAWRSRKTP